MKYVIVVAIAGAASCTGLDSMTPPTAESLSASASSATTSVTFRGLRMEAFENERRVWVATASSATYDRSNQRLVIPGRLRVSPTPDQLVRPPSPK